MYEPDDQDTSPRYDGFSREDLIYKCNVLTRENETLREECQNRDRVIAAEQHRYHCTEQVLVEKDAKLEEAASTFEQCKAERDGYKKVATGVARLARTYNDGTEETTGSKGVVVWVDEPRAYPGPWFPWARKFFYNAFNNISQGAPQDPGHVTATAPQTQSNNDAHTSNDSSKPAAIPENTTADATAATATTPSVPQQTGTVQVPENAARQTSKLPEMLKGCNPG